ncbi:Uncharacterised protein [Mycobacteroides abscessus subsp. abscessus]|nr:Uncharacterised protein [Mycobacteroides abscessus subsp. abscessus]
MRSTGNGAASISACVAVPVRWSPDSSTPEGTGKFGDSAEARVAMTTSARSAGVMMKSPSPICSRKLPTVIAATFTAWMSRSAEAPRAVSSRARLRMTSATVGWEIAGFSGITYTCPPRRPAGVRSATSCAHSGSTRLTTTPSRSVRAACSSERVTSTELTMSSTDSASPPLITASTEQSMVLARRALRSNSAVAALCASRSVPSTITTS